MRVLWAFLSYVTGIALVCAAFYAALVFALTPPSGEAIAAKPEASLQPQSAVPARAPAAPTATVQPAERIETSSAAMETTGAAPAPSRPVHEPPPYAKWAKEKALRELGGRSARRQAPAPAARDVPQRIPNEALNAYGAAEPAPRPSVPKPDLHRVY